MMLPTIYALSSGEGRAGVAVIRISGPTAFATVENMTGRSFEQRRATLTTFHSQIDRQMIDRGLVVMFPAPESFTGEDIAELHVHGSPAVIQRVLKELANYEGLTLAQPGEFTQRAFTNGKMDLTEVEGLADLIAANTELQRLQAMAQSSGILRERSEAWRQSLIRALALIEAVLDFSDEPDVTGAPIAEAKSIAAGLRNEIALAIADTSRAETIRNGFRVALIGPPNVGKSSLLNALAARDIAIVTQEAGTTRDTIEVNLDLKGMPLTLVDTAGIRDTQNPIEQEGIRRAQLAAENADLVIQMSAADQLEDATCRSIETSANTIHIINKCDLTLAASPDKDSDTISVSAKTGEGLDALIECLTERAIDAAGKREPPIVTRERQRLHLEACMTALTNFSEGEFAHPELRAEDLRQAANALGRLAGRIDVEDVLDDIFAGFCIGK